MRAYQNIYTFSQDLTTLSQDKIFAVSQRQFFKQLLQENSGYNGWRSFEEIAKHPRIERKLGRVEAQLTLEIAKLSIFNIIKKTKLMIIKSVLTDISTDVDSKIQYLLDQKNHFSKHPLYLRLQKTMDQPLPWSNDVDHLLDAITKELRCTSWFDRHYRRTLNNLHMQLSSFNQHQTENWIKAEQHYARLHHRRHQLLLKTTHPYSGKMVLPAHQTQEYRLGNSSGECFGYVMRWGKSLLEDDAFYGLRADTPTTFQPTQYHFSLVKHHPGLNHLMPLTPEIAYYQALQSNRTQLLQALNSSRTTYRIKKNLWKSSFMPSLKDVAYQLVHCAEKTENGVILLYLNGYLSSHIVGFCKKNDQYHFFDANFGWLRWKNSKDFKAWLPFYLHQLGYTKRIAEYEMSTMQHGASPSPKTKLPPSRDLVKFIRRLTHQFHFYIIRGLFYAYFHFIRIFSDLRSNQDQGILWPSREQKKISYAHTLNLLEQVQHHSTISHALKETVQHPKSNQHRALNPTSLWSKYHTHQPSAHNNTTQVSRPYLRQEVLWRPPLTKDANKHVDQPLATNAPASMDHPN